MGKRVDGEAMTTTVEAVKEEGVEYVLANLSNVSLNDSINATLNESINATANSTSTSALAGLTDNILSGLHGFLGDCVKATFGFVGIQLGAAETALVLTTIGIALFVWRVYTLSTFIRMLIVAACIITAILVFLSASKVI